MMGVPPVGAVEPLCLNSARGRAVDGGAHMADIARGLADAGAHDAGAPAPPVPRDAPDGARAVDFFVFNTTVSLYAYPGETGDAADPASRAPLDAALDAAWRRCWYFERAFSRTRPDSDISRAHAAAPDPVAVRPETAELVRLALGYCARSDGLFDITMGTVTSLWDFHERVVPSRRDLARALGHVGFDRIRVSGPGEPPRLAVTDPETVLDLGGVAKGYIADDLARLMEGLGVPRLAINLGGNVVVRGGRPAEPAARPPVAAGAPWRIGIVNPFDPAHHRAVVDVRDGSVVTSGVHERCFIKGGVRYHHILDPRTGMPATSDVVSATIVADRSLDCDGWSTTAFMMGAERALAFIEGITGVDAVLVTEGDEVRWTGGVADRLSLVPTLPRLF